MGSDKVGFRWFRQGFRKVDPHKEYCGYDGTRLTPVSRDFSLTLRYTALACRWDTWGDDHFQDFKLRIQNAAELLQDNDHEKRVEGASIIVKLVEEGANVLQEVGPFLQCKNCGQIIEEGTNPRKIGPPRYCHNCGHLVKEGADACQDCGYKVKKGPDLCPNCGGKDLTYRTSIHVNRVGSKAATEVQ